MKLSKTLKVATISAGIAALSGCTGASSMQMNEMMEQMNELTRTVNTADYNAAQAKAMANETKMMMRMMMNRMGMKKPGEMRKMMK